MSSEEKSEELPLRLFLTAPHPCSYLKGNEATTLFLDPEKNITHHLYQTLTDKGFRRSGQHLYRPYCSQCQSCLSVRIPVARFSPDRAQRRTFKRNSDITTEITPSRFSDEHFALYQRYISQRHQDGEMFPPDETQYRSFLVTQHSFSRMVEFRLEGELVAVAVIDLLMHGISAIYTFYAPELQHQKRSLGRYAILWQIETAKAMAIPYVYLGYWIKESHKMSYKSAYRPLEYMNGRQWITLKEEE